MECYSEISTERLLLRQLKEADWEMISYLRSDETVNKFVKRPKAETKEAAVAFISKINKGIEDQSFYYWSITKQGNDQMIGSICLWNFSEDHKTAEVGYDLHPDYQRQGIMDESLKSVLAYGFDNLQLIKIEAFTQWQNQSSTNLLTRNGFVLDKEKECEHNPDNRVYTRVK